MAKKPIKNKGLKTSDLLLLFLQKNVFEGTKIAIFGGFSMFFSELSALQDNLWLSINTLTYLIENQENIKVGVALGAKVRPNEVPCCGKSKQIGIIHRLFHILHELIIISIFLHSHSLLYLNC